MKRYLNYVLILSNVLTFIGVVLGLGLFLTWKDNLVSDDPNIVGATLRPEQLIDNMHKLVALPICMMIASCLILGFYQWKVYRLIKENTEAFNIKTLNNIKLVAYGSIANYVITGILGMAACLLKDQSWDARIILFSIAIGLSAITGMIIIGIISYLNLRISYEEAKRNGEIANNQKSTEVSKKQASNVHKDDKQATSGSF